MGQARPAGDRSGSKPSMPACMTSSWSIWTPILRLSEQEVSAQRETGTIRDLIDPSDPGRCARNSLARARRLRRVTYLSGSMDATPGLSTLARSVARVGSTIWGISGSTTASSSINRCSVTPGWLPGDHAAPPDAEWQIDVTALVIGVRSLARVIPRPGDGVLPAP